MQSLKEMIKAKKQEEPPKAELPDPYFRKLWRQGAGLNQFEAAEIIAKHSGQDVSRNRYANWELGFNSPTPDLFDHFKEFLQACREVFEEKQKELGGTSGTGSGGEKGSKGRG